MIADCTGTSLRWLQQVISALVNIAQSGIGQDLGQAYVNFALAEALLLQNDWMEAHSANSSM